MNNRTKKDTQSIINFAERVRQMSTDVYSEMAHKFRLNELHSQLLVARGKDDLIRYKKLTQANASKGFEATELLSMMRQSATLDATLFHELEKLETKWKVTTFPTLEVLIFFWARSKRAGKSGLKASLRMREEFVLRSREIAKIFYDGAIGLLDITDEKLKQTLANIAASIIMDYVEVLLENLPNKKVEFFEPAGWQQSLDIVSRAIEPIADKDLPILPSEIGIFECAGQILNYWLSHRDITGLNSDVLALRSVKDLGKDVTSISFIAVGVPIP